MIVYAGSARGQYVHGAVRIVTSLTRSVTLQILDLQRKNEPGRSNGVTITTSV